MENRRQMPAPGGHLAVCEAHIQRCRTARNSKSVVFIAPMHSFFRYVDHTQRVDNHAWSLSIGVAPFFLDWFPMPHP
jgi:hypothetical protein